MTVLEEHGSAHGIQPRLRKSTTYHAIRRLGRWGKASAARTAFVQRLVASECPRTKATDLSWRLLEDMLRAAGDEPDLRLVVIDAELDAMHAYGEEQKFPERPSEAEVAATLAEAIKVFGGDHGVSRLPTTIAVIYMRLGLWEHAAKYLRRDNPDGDQIENCSTSAAWRVLAGLLGSQTTVAEIAGGLKRILAEPSTRGSRPGRGDSRGRK